MKSSTLILLLSAWGILATMVCVFQRQDLAAYKEADAASAAKRIHWDSIRHQLPSEGYVGFLKAEQNWRNAKVTYWINRNVVNYWTDDIPTFSVTVSYGLVGHALDRTLIQLDSADIAYFHRKAVSQISQERKKAVEEVNQQFNAIEKEIDWNTSWNNSSLKINP